MPCSIQASSTGWSTTSRRPSPNAYGVLGKFRIADNQCLNDEEYQLACVFCHVVGEVLRVGETELPGGIFWGEVGTTAAHSIYQRKNRQEIDCSMLLNNRFRDFPTIIYEFDKLTPKPDFWVYRYKQLCKAVPERWHVRIPSRFGEIGWNVAGVPVNRHTAVLQERINAQLYLGMEDVLNHPTPRVLEIGGGSGEMAHTVCRAVPSVTWYDCDLAHSLIYNAIHMAIWFPEKKHYIYVGDLQVSGVDERYVLRSATEAASIQNAVVNIPHFLLRDFEGILEVNLALNAWSFSEMPTSEVERYADFIQRHLAKGGSLMEQNGIYAGRGGSNAKEVFERVFPVRQSGEAMQLMGGPMDAWAAGSVEIKEIVDVHSFENHLGEPDLEYTPSYYSLLQQVLGPSLVL